MGAKRTGFTLIELMLVVIIISVLAVAIVPRLTGRTEQAKVARAKSDIASIALALDLYELDVGRYPDALAGLTDSGASNERNWSGPYLRKGVPLDPWGNEYVYSRESQHNQDYDLYSLGPDGSPGNDDITNWE